MTRRTRLLAGVGAGFLMLCAPLAGAQARTKSVDMGTPVSAQKTIQNTYGADVNAFFPNKITINVGDRVRFRPLGFHSVDFPKKGTGPVGLVSTGAPIAGALDAASVPFWFNGQPQLGFAAPLLKSNFGKTLSYTGAASVNSGAPLSDRPKPFTVRFPRAGTHTYFCDIHPGMKAHVRVLSRGRRVPSAAADARAKKAQITRATTAVKKLAAVTVPPNTMLLGSAGPGGVEHLAILPARLTVAPGTTVTFAMDKGSYEDHTATTGPGDPERQATSYLGQIASAFTKPVFDPAAAVYPSEPPGTVGGLTPALHGNGFWNSGVLDASPDTPLPDRSSVRFDAAGTYEFYCLIHPFMHGTVVVQ